MREEIGRVYREDSFKTGARFRRPPQAVERERKLALHFAVARIFAGDPAKRIRRFPDFPLGAPDQRQLAVG